MHNLIEEAPLARALAAVLRRRYPGHLFEGAKLLVDDIVDAPCSAGNMIEDRVRLMTALLELNPHSAAAIAQGVREVEPEPEDEGIDHADRWAEYER